MVLLAATSEIAAAAAIDYRLSGFSARQHRHWRVLFADQASIRPTPASRPLRWPSGQSAGEPVRPGGRVPDLARTWIPHQVTIA